LAYAPNLFELGSIWLDDPNYSHGFLVIPIALFILWRRLASTMDEPFEEGILAPWWGWVFLTAVLVARAVAYERESQWMETATILPAVACLVWSFGGWPLLHRIWPAVVFLVFMLPLPSMVNTLIALPLQWIAASGSYFLLQVCGFWVVQHGTTLDLQTPYGIRHLDIAIACNGLKMLMTLTATVAATIILLPLPSWKRIALLVFAVPTALISNILRILVTGWCSYYLQGLSAREWAHDVSGWSMMPMALILVGLELALLSWLVPQEKREDDRKLIISQLTPKKPEKAKSDNKDLDDLT
jgi:exosortase